MNDLSIITNMILAILSFLLCVFSIIFVILTLRQNKKLIEQNNRMLEESMRPYITIYLDALTICEQTSFFVLKNFGHSTATITRFEYSECLKHTSQSDLILNQFDCIQGITLSPGQSKMLVYKVSLLNTDTVYFKYEYVSSGKCYNDELSINVKNYIHIPVSRPEDGIPKGNERLVHTLREMIEHSI